jgi:glutamate-1-semialdehyde 2,1-aminomutase
LYHNASATWASRQDRLNELLKASACPVRVAGMETVWSVMFETPGRYNWMLQYYLREQGIALSWVGSGRMIFSLNFDNEAFELFCKKFVQAAKHMQEDGWWWTPENQTNRNIRKQVFREMLRSRLSFSQ